MKEEDGKPKIGSRFGELGVRPQNDIPVDDQGHVGPQTGGMSVAGSIRDLDPSLVPKRLRKFVEGAHGANSHKCWRFGDGPYVTGGLTEELTLRIDEDGKHGYVEPSTEMLLDTFQTALARTRTHWEIDED